MRQGPSCSLCVCRSLPRLTACSIKCAEATGCLCKDSKCPLPLHCVCFSAGLRALISGAEIWQSQQVMTEAVVRSHPEPQRRLTFQADERSVQYTKALISGVWSCCCSKKSHISTCLSCYLIFYMNSVGYLCTFEHLEDIWWPRSLTIQLKVQLLLFSFFFLVNR